MIAAAIFASTLASLAPVRAADVMEPAPAVETRISNGWRVFNPLGPCEMNCTATVFVGKYIATAMTDIFIKYKVAPWDWKTDDTTLLSGAFNREIVAYSDLFAFEGELGVGKRFGEQDQWEYWVALYARWKKFPWHDYVRTTVGVSTGFNYASDISGIEKLKSPSATSRLLHYLSPEITFGLPSQPNLDLVFRFHHRSGGDLALFDKTGGGSQYQTVGLRYRW